MYSISVENISCGTSVYANCLRESEEEISRQPLFLSYITVFWGWAHFVKTNFLWLIGILFERFTDRKEL